jgi:hypothetical protein
MFRMIDRVLGGIEDDVHGCETTPLAYPKQSPSMKHPSNTRPPPLSSLAAAASSSSARNSGGARGGAYLKGDTERLGAGLGMGYRTDREHVVRSPDLHWQEGPRSGRFFWARAPMGRRRRCVIRDGYEIQSHDSTY